MIYSCCDQNRRVVLESQSVYNGIDFLEVVDHPSDSNDMRQRTLLVHFVRDLFSGQLTLANVRIDGGERITNIAITHVEEEGFLSQPGDPKILIVQVAKPGDFSTYTLRLVDSNDDTKLPSNIDPVLSRIDFSFKVACPSDFDCEQPSACPPEPPEPVDISHLAKDYASFRQLMLDRIAKIMPQWQERNPADLGIVLVEMLSYVGDYLSYQQDAVATEAYLNTARRRTSIRRHARLVGYPMHDGANARTWAHFEVRSDIHGLILTKRTPSSASKLLTRVASQPVLFKNSSPALQDALSQGPRVFELAEDTVLFAEHNRMSFYAWGARQCCLPQWSTQAYLRGNFINLQPGNVLIFQEVKGPDTGVEEDADPRHRCAVRLTIVSFASDPIGGLFDPYPTSNPVPVTLIQWSIDDALPFPVCISSQVGTQYFDEVSVALGNIALADDGNTIEQEQLETAPAPNPALTLVVAHDDPCHKVPPKPAPPRYRPQLRQYPITFAEPYAAGGVFSIHYLGASSSLIMTKSGALLTFASSGSDGHVVNLASGQGADTIGKLIDTINSFGVYTAGKTDGLEEATASEAIHDVSDFALTVSDYVDVRGATTPASNLLAKRALDQLLPCITLTAIGSPDSWNPQRDLLRSHTDSKEFVVEVENDSGAYLRFGDGTFGERPTPGTQFLARYRVGNGAAGNIGADSLYHFGSDDPNIVSDLSHPVVLKVSNPLAAEGGLNPESLESVRQRAPYAFRVQDRAVTPDDYAEMAQRCDSGLQRAAATFRWTGSWYSVFLAADRQGGTAVDAPYRAGLGQCLERYRMAGHDLEVDLPVFVSLEIHMDVCVKSDYFASAVEQALLLVLSNRVLPDGTLGAFHPDNFTFGQPVYLSPLYALAQSTAGVDSVRFTVFQRQGLDSDVALTLGRLDLNRLEIARLDNDINFPEHGLLKLNMLGGR
ncbi:MAG TPA: putative baseplate assembly protein [Terracidiphilus sp.]